MDSNRDWTRWIGALNRNDLADLLGAIGEELVHRRIWSSAELVRLAAIGLRRQPEFPEVTRG